MWFSKRLLPLVAVLALWAQPAHAAIALVEHKGASSTTTNAVTTAAGNTTGANFIAACGASGTASPAVPTDSKGNMYQKLTTYVINGGGAYITVFYTVNPTVSAGSADHTVTFGASGSFPAISWAAFSGVNTSAPFDSPQDVGTSTTSPGTVTPSVNNALAILCGVDVNDVFVNVTGGGGYTITDSLAYSAGAAYGDALAYQIQTTATATAPTWVEGATGNAGSALAVFKPVAGAAATGCTLAILGVGKC